MLSFRFKRDIHGNIFGVVSHDFKCYFAAEFFANSTGLYYKPEFPYNDKWTVIDADFRLTGNDDYRRKKLRRAVVMSFQYRKALKEYIECGGNLTDAEIDSICNCLPFNMYSTYMNIIRGIYENEKE